MALLRLRMLGGLALYFNDGTHPVVLKRRKAETLLALLASPVGRERYREDLAEMLWGRTGESGARNNLRQSLYLIRRNLPDFNGLIATRDRLSLDPEYVSTDVSEFEACAAQGNPSALEMAARAYRGKFLDGVNLPEPSFEDWHRGEVERLREIYLSVLERLLGMHLADGTYEKANHAATMLVSVDPLHEMANEALIAISAMQGRNGEASRKFEAFANTLRTELGVSPTSDLQTIASRIVHAPAIVARWANATGVDEAPVVAALPFDHSDRASQDVAHAIAPKLIAALSKALPVPIVDHHSILAASNEDSSTIDLAARFGASYAVEGFVRTKNKRSRVDFSLIDESTRRQLFADSCEVTTADLFQSGARIARQVAGQVAFRIERAERRRATLSAEETSAWALFNRGMALIDAHASDAIILAQRDFKTALQIEPNNARIIAGLAQAVLQEGVCLVGRSRDETFAESLELAHRAYALEPEDPFVNMVLCKAYHRRKRFELALEFLETASRAAPASPDIRSMLGNLLCFMGVPEKGIPLLVASSRSTDRYLVTIARAYLQIGAHQQSRRWAERVIELQPKNSLANVVLGSTLGHMDKPDEASRILNLCETFHPGRVDAEFGVSPTQYARPKEHEHILAGLELAGWRP